jgi:hypothetical protein
MTGPATARCTRPHFLIVAAIAAAACVAAFAFGRAVAQTTPDYAGVVAAPDRSAADRDADKRAIRHRSSPLPRRVLA